MKSTLVTSGVFFLKHHISNKQKTRLTSKGVHFHEAVQQCKDVKLNVLFESLVIVERQRKMISLEKCIPHDVTVEHKLGP